MFEDLRKPKALIVIVVILLAYGCPIQAKEWSDCPRLWSTTIASLENAPIGRSLNSTAHCACMSTASNPR